MSTLEYKLRADDRELMQSLQRAADGFQRMNKRAQEAGQMTERLNSVASRLGATLAGFVGAGAFLSFTKNALSEFARIGDLADRLNVSGDAMQRLAFLAGQGGTDVEVMARALTKLNAALGGTGPEAEKMRQALRDLGINVEQFIALPVDRQLAELSAGFDAGGGNAESFSKSLEILGIKAADMIPTLRMGKDAMLALADSAPIISNEVLDSIKAYDDQIQRLSTNLKVAVANQAGFLGYLSRYAGTWASLLGGKPLGEAVSENFKTFDPNTDAAKWVRENTNATYKQAQDRESWWQSLGPSTTVTQAAQAVRASTRIKDYSQKGAMKWAADYMAEVMKDRVSRLEDAAKIAEDEAKAAMGRETALSGMLRSEKDRAAAFGKPGALDNLERARSIQDATGIGADEANAIVAGQNRLGAAEAAMELTRHFQIVERRRQRTLEREGRAMIRARRYLDRGGDVRPVGVSKRVWDDLQREAAALDRTVAGRHKLDDAFARARADADKARADLPLFVRDIRDRIGGGVGDSVVENLKKLQKQLSGVVRM